MNELSSGCVVDIDGVRYQVDYTFFPPRDDADVSGIYVYSIHDQKQEDELSWHLNVGIMEKIEREVYESIARGDDL